MSSAIGKFYPGIALDANTFGTANPTNPGTLYGANQPFASLPAPRGGLRSPADVPGTVAPFIVGADGPDRLLFTALDGLIAEHKVPVMIAVSIGNGSGDAQGSERGLEYDTMSGCYGRNSWNPRCCPKWKNAFTSG